VIVWGWGYVACMGKLRNRTNRITIIDSGINRTQWGICKVTDCLKRILKKHLMGTTDMMIRFNEGLLLI